MWTWLKNIFQPLIRALWGFLKVIFKGALEIALAQLRELAIETVREIAMDTTLLTDEDKRKEGFERLKEKAMDRGIETRDSILNLALELSVSFCKKKGWI